jgi:hypothetical protein
MEVTEGEEDSTAAVVVDFMEVAEEGFTAAVVVDFMEVAEEGFTGVEVSLVEATLVTAADTPSADFVVAATTVVAAAMAGPGGATAGAADIGDTATDGGGDLVSGGRIGVGDGEIRMTTATAHGFTRLTAMILTLTTGHQTIRRTIRILTMGTTILHRQIPARGPSPTRTDPADPGDPRYREAQPRRTTQTAASRPLRCLGPFSPLTG